MWSGACGNITKNDWKIIIRVEKARIYKNIHQGFCFYFNPFFAFFKKKQVFVLCLEKNTKTLFCISVRECIFLGCKKVLPKFDLAFANNLQTASRNVNTKTYHCKLIKVSACLIRSTNRPISTWTIEAERWKQSVRDAEAIGERQFVTFCCRLEWTVAYLPFAFQAKILGTLCIKPVYRDFFLSSLFQLYRIQWMWCP